LSDGAALDAVAQRWPQESRSWAEGVLPSEWAAAANADDATQHLSAARALAESVKRKYGDQMAVDAIAVIDRANPRQRHDLAAAYRAYRDGRVQLGRQNPAHAEESLRRAAALFERGASPMSQVALYFVALALGQRDKGLASIAMLRELIPTIDGTRYPALLGQAEWELGLREAFRGNWNSALLFLADANAILSRLGETANAALVQATLAELHDRLGQIELGWQQRTPALEALSRSGADERFAAALAGAIRAEIARGDVASAIALCRVSVEEMRLSANKVLVAETYIRLAQILGYSGGIDGAHKALAEAIAATRLIADPALRAQRLAELVVVEADLVRTSDPKRALAMLDSSLRYYAENDLSMLVPAAYLARGRTARAMGDTQAACDSFEKGIDELTRQRRNVGAREIRETVFDSGRALFTELIDLRLKRREVGLAFETIENPRARTLLEGLSSSSPHSQLAAFADIAAHRNPGSIVLEYAILPDRLAIFVIANGRLHVVEHPISERQLAESVTRYVDAIVRRESVASVRRSSSIVYAHLIAPVASFAKPAKTIVIVPDRFLHAIPFAALFDGSRWFIEEHELVFAPSSSALFRPRVVAQTSPNILIVTDPPGSEDVLAGARRESSAIALTYGNAATILSGPDATVAKFRAMAPLFSIIHYSGHARADAVAAELPLIAESAADRLDGSAIAAMQLPRTSLVVLAACDTIRGATNRIEGMPSLARAFLAAGSDAVIGALWKIEDRSSARFFSDFHKRLHGGSPPAAALAETQRHFLRSPDASLNHPATWSSLQFIGSE
jgi:CHAT domain-containing protein